MANEKIQKLYATVIVGPQKALNKFIGLSWPDALSLAKGMAGRSHR